MLSVTVRAFARTHEEVMVPQKVPVPQKSWSRKKIPVLQKSWSRKKIPVLQKSWSRKKIPVLQKSWSRKIPVENIFLEKRGVERKLDPH